MGVKGTSKVHNTENNRRIVLHNPFFLQKNSRSTQNSPIFNFMAMQFLHTQAILPPHWPLSLHFSARFPPCFTSP